LQICFVLNKKTCLNKQVFGEPKQTSVEPIYRDEEPVMTRNANLLARVSMTKSSGFECEQSEQDCESNLRRG